ADGPGRHRRVPRHQPGRRERAAPRRMAGGHALYAADRHPRGARRHPAVDAEEGRLSRSYLPRSAAKAEAGTQPISASRFPSDRAAWNEVAAFWHVSIESNVASSISEKEASLFPESTARRMKMELMSAMGHLFGLDRA